MFMGYLLDTLGFSLFGYLFNDYSGVFFPPLTSLWSQRLDLLLCYL